MDNYLSTISNITMKSTINVTLRWLVLFKDFFILTPYASLVQMFRSSKTMTCRIFDNVMHVYPKQNEMLINRISKFIFMIHSYTKALHEAVFILTSSLY